MGDGGRFRSVNETEMRPRSSFADECGLNVGVACATMPSHELAPYQRLGPVAAACGGNPQPAGARGLIGNGASASMASHFAADLAKNARLHTEVFSDLSLVTAIANDMGYENVFSEPLSRRAAAGDLLVAISSSGRSPNVLRAVQVARKLKLAVVTLSGMDEQNPLRAAGDLNFFVPAKTYGLAETCHFSILHHWMDLVAASAD